MTGRINKLFVVVLIIILTSCDKRRNSTDSIEPLHINICVLGNSYSNDSYCYLPFILKQFNITSKIHIYYRGSGSLRDLYQQWYDDGPTGYAELDGMEHVRLHFSIDTRYDSAWKNESNISPDNILSLEQWDIISIQQASNLAKEINSYYPYIYDIIDRINKRCPYRFNLAWFMAYNRAEDNYNELNLKTQKTIVYSYPFDLVFPVSTAIFLAQTTELSRLGDSEYKNLYCSDNVHLQEGIPCYIAALTIAQSILDYYKPDLYVYGNLLNPTQQWLESINAITPNGKSIGVNNKNIALAESIAIISNRNKFSIMRNDL